MKIEFASKQMKKSLYNPAFTGKASFYEVVKMVGGDTYYLSEKYRNLHQADAELRARDLNNTLRERDKYNNQ